MKSLHVLFAPTIFIVAVGLFVLRLLVFIFISAVSVNFAVAFIHCSALTAGSYKTWTSTLSWIRQEFDMCFKKSIEEIIK